MLLNDIKFPVFAISNSISILEEYGILYGVTELAKYKIDNTNLSGDTLGKRRRRIPRKDRYNFPKVFLTFEQLLIAKPYKRYIDNSGHLFSYSKSTWTTVSTHKVRKQKHIEGEGILVYLNNVDVPLIIPAIKYDVEYVSVINTKGGPVFHSISDSMKPTRRIKI